MNIESLFLILYGLLGGFLAGLLGIGGGVIYILILPIALKNADVCDDHIIAYTIANSVFAIFIASLSGNLVNYFKKKLYYKEIFFIGIPASIISILSMRFIVTQPWYSKSAFNIIVIVLLVFMFVKMLMKSKSSDGEKPLSNAILGGIGGSAGLVSALTGLGGGILVVPLLQAFFHLPIKKAKDISLGVIGVLAMSLSGYNLFQEPSCSSDQFQQGLIVFPVVLIMIIGVLIGSPAGVWLSHKLRPHYIKIIFVILLVSVIIKKLLELS